MTEKEKMQSQKLYDANYDSELERERIECKALCQEYNHLPIKETDQDKDKGTPGGGNGQDSGKKTPMNKLKNRMAAVTGDEARPMLYVLAAIAAAAVVISVTVIRRKNK